MKNRFFVLSTLAVAALALVSCAKEQDVNTVEKPQGIPFEIVANSIQTKTVNDDMSTLWVAGDQINLFHVVSGETAYVNDGAFEASADGASVSFTGTISPALTDGNYNWFALYPYDALYDAPDGSAFVAFPSAQTQIDNNSKAHLAGANCPVAGNVKNVAHDATPVVDFSHLTSIVKVHVTNKTAATVTVSGVSFTAPININGTFSLALTGDSPVVSGAGSSKTTNLTVTGSSDIAADGSADYFLAIKPFTAAAGQEISLTVTTGSGPQTLSAILPTDYTFAAGQISTLNFNYTSKSITVAQFKYSDPDWLDGQTITKPAKSAGTSVGGSTHTVTPISFVASGGSPAPRVWNTSDEGSYDLRIYNGATFTISSTSGYIINKISFTGAALPASSLIADNGTYNDAAHTWTGFTQSVKFSVTAQQNFNTIYVYYQAATASDYILQFPVKSVEASYDATTSSFTPNVLNVLESDITVKDAFDADATFSFDGTTLTITHPANALTTTNNLTYKVNCAKAGVSNETLTIVQAAAPAKINTLTTGSGKTAIGKVAAVSTKGFILADDTAAIFVYSNADETGRSIGDIVKVSGTVSEYSTGLQFTNSGLSVDDATGSITYNTTPTDYDVDDIKAFLAAEHNTFADLITISGVVRKPSSYVNIVVGGGSTNNATVYAPANATISGITTGKYVTVTGYAINISSSCCAIIATSVTKDDDVPALLFDDISDISGAAGNGNHTISPYRLDGWTVTVESKPTWVTAAAPHDANWDQLDYTVTENGATERSSNIVITLTKGLDTYTYTIKITQNANLRTETIQFSTLSLTNDTQYASFGSAAPANLNYFTISFAGGANDGKYYTTGSGIRTYGDGTIKVASTTNTISKIEFTWSGNSYKPASDDVSSPAGYVSSTGVWTGSAASVVLTRPSGSGHWRLQKVKVTFSD